MMVEPNLKVKLMKRLLFISSLVIAGAFTCTSCSSCAPQGGSKSQMKSMSQDKPQDQGSGGQGCGKPCSPCDSCPAPASPCDNAAVAPKSAPEAVAPKAPSMNAQVEKKVEKQKPVVSDAPQKEALPIVKEDRVLNDSSKTTHAEANKSEEAISLVKKDAPAEHTSGN
jgi:hypothetical protein